MLNCLYKLYLDKCDRSFLKSNPVINFTSNRLRDAELNQFEVNTAESTRGRNLPAEKLFSIQIFYFKIIYLHIIGMKTGWYICDGTGPYRNFQSIQKPLFQTWTKWINILVNKYISDMSLYWNVLLYIKYNTISFLVLLFSFCTQSIQRYTDISLKRLEGFLLIAKAV